MWTSYSARHAAQLIGLAESAVRSCIRDGLVGTPGTLPAQLTFRDLAALRTVKALVDAGMPLPRVRRELGEIQKQLPAGTSLAELTVEARDGRICVRGAAPLDRPGQLPLPLEIALDVVPPPAGELRELPRPPEAPAPMAKGPQNKGPKVISKPYHLVLSGRRSSVLGLRARRPSSSRA